LELDKSSLFFKTVFAFGFLHIKYHPLINCFKQTLMSVK